MKYISLFLLVLLVACGQSKKESVKPIDTSTLLAKEQHQVKVEEVLQTSAYTYLRVAENGKDYWIAVARIDARVGENYYYKDGLEMKDFKSKELDRVFKQVFFVDKISSTPIGHSAQNVKANDEKAKQAVSEKQEIKLDIPEGAITIGELYSNSSNYSGKKVLVHGKVVKVNKAIMSKNWVHLQDGTSGNDKFDLTLTTNDEVNVGDEVSFEGLVTLNKDFGAGYFYELIVEEAEIK